jgi:hypothetical protein
MQRRAVRVAREKGTRRDVRELQSLASGLERLEKKLNRVGVLQDLDRGVRPRGDVSVIPEEMRSGLDAIHDNLVDADRRVGDAIDEIRTQKRAAATRIRQIERLKRQR